jgi:5'-AMP-activated protein kinase catalytic alpha subunit
VYQHYTSGKHQNLLTQIEEAKENKLYDVEVIQKELEELTEDAEEIQGRPAHEKQKWEVKRKVRVAFKRDLAPPFIDISFYLIGRVLGKGAFGKVNLALHKLTRCLCAVKSVNKQITRDQAKFNKWRQEKWIHTHLRHDNVVMLLESVETATHHLLFMELCRGGDLLHFVRRRRRLDEDVAKVIFKQLVAGLGYIHKRGFMHRDIKLENILLDNLGTVKIADFGVSCPITKENEGMASECCGTPAYMAPEVVRCGEKDVKQKKGAQSTATKDDQPKRYGKECDIWSLGVVLYGMLFGTLPFKGNNAREIKHEVKKGILNIKGSIS